MVVAPREVKNPTENCSCQPPMPKKWATFQKEIESPQGWSRDTSTLCPTPPDRPGLAAASLPLCPCPWESAPVCSSHCLCTSLAGFPLPWLFPSGSLGGFSHFCGSLCPPSLSRIRVWAPPGHLRHCHPHRVAESPLLSLPPYLSPTDSPQVSPCFLSLDVSLSLLFSLHSLPFSPFSLPPACRPIWLAGWGRGDLGAGEPGLLFTFCVTKNFGDSSESWMGHHSGSSLSPSPTPPSPAAELAPPAAGAGDWGED